MARHVLDDGLGEGLGPGRGADQHRGLDLPHHLFERDVPSAVALPAGDLVRL